MKHSLVICLLIFMTGCTKPSADAEGKDFLKPRLTIIAPSKSEVYRSGDPLCFKGDAIDAQMLSSVKLKLFSGDDNMNPVIEYSYPVNERSIYIEQKIFIPDALHGNCQLQFEATDYSGNRAVSSLNFSAN